MSRFIASLVIVSVLWIGGHLALAANLHKAHPLNAKPHTEGRNFTSSGSLEVGRASHTATLLPDEKILIAGGYSDGTLEPIASAELYNPKTATSSYTGSMTSARSKHTATLLTNGKVLIVGGQVADYSLTATAELYDPATGVFTATGSMSYPREFHTATLLGDGQVLVTGGVAENGTLDSAELYNPATGAFTSVGSMTTPRDLHTATLLANGKVLIAGGEPKFVGTPLDTAEVYDPTAQTFTATGSMFEARSSQTATLLTDGKVLMTGGEGTIEPLASAELFDPTAGTFSTTGSLTAPRYGHSATVLKNGNVLIATGYSLISPLLIFEPSFTAEIYNSAKGAFTDSGPMVAGRTSAAATLLHNGTVLFSGGLTDGVTAGAVSYFTDNIAEMFKLGGGRCTPGQPGCGWRGGDLLTFDQFAWPLPDYPASTWVEQDFYEVYSGQGRIMLLGGSPSGYNLGFSSPFEVLEFLPQSGPPAPLDQSYFDETTSSAGEFGGDIVALKLNIDFSDAGILLGNPKIAFGDLTLCNLGTLPALNGYTVRQFLGLANTVLAGGSGPYDIGTIDSVTQVLNDAFGNENVSTFAQQYLVNGPCP